MKTITLTTKITFNETGDKYAIIEQTPSGFQFKPIKFEKGLPTVPRTFEEVKEEFLSKHISIEGFEHNEADSTLVELIMDGYIKQSEIESLKNCAVDLASEKGKMEAQNQIHETAISEQQVSIQEQKDYIQGQKDEITNLKVQIINFKTSLEIAKREHEDDKANWESEKQKFEETIEGLQAMAE